MQLQVEEFVEGVGDVLQGYVVLWVFWFGQVGFDFVYVQVQGVGEYWFVVFFVLQVLFFVVGFDQFDCVFWMFGQVQVVEGDFVYWEEVVGGVVFWGYVGDGGVVCQGQVGQVVVVEFDEFFYYVFFVQYLCDGQYQVGGGDVFVQFVGEFEVDDFGDQY